MKALPERGGGARSLSGRLARRRARRVTAVVGLLIWLGPPARISAQQPSPAATERRLLDWAARLVRADRAAEALSVLEELLEAQPRSEAGLTLLLEVAGRERPIDAFLWRFERAAGEAEATPQVRRVWVDALLAAGRLDSARSVATRWAAARPLEADAYLAWARAAEASGDPPSAIRALQLGRDEMGDKAAFAAELARHHLEIGELDAAAAEWLILLAEGKQAPALESVLRELGEERAPAIAALADAIEREGGETAAGAALLFLRLGEAERAGRVARRLAEQLSRDALVAFLGEYAGEARVRGEAAEGAWAAERLAEQVDDLSSRDRWSAAAADLALQAGDTTRARRAFGRLIERVPPGSEAHRVTARRLYGLSLAKPRRAEGLLEAYEALYPRPAADLARMRVELARGYVRVGLLLDAARVLGAVEPPVATDSTEVVPLLATELARVRLYAGDPDGALEALRGAASMPGGDPATQTRAIALYGALRGADSTRAARFGVLLHNVARLRERPAMASSIQRWEESDPPAEMMAIAAEELDEAGYLSEAAGLRERLVVRHPDAPEAPAALLEIARYERERLARDAGGSAAVRRLERLITEYPESALTPLARRLRAEWTESPTAPSGG